MSPGLPDRGSRPGKTRRIEGDVEECLARMAEAGELSGLPGEGRPLADRDIEAESQRLARVGRAHREWLCRRQEQLAALPAERILEAAQATRERDAKVRAQLGEAVSSLNLAIARFNSIVPVDSLQLLPFRTERILRG